MTIPSPSTACRFLQSLWPAPARFTAIGPDGAVLAGDPGLAQRAAAVLARAPAGALVVRDGELLVARHAPAAGAMAAEVPGAALPGLLEADLLRVTSGGA